MFASDAEEQLNAEELRQKLVAERAATAMLQRELEDTGVCNVTARRVDWCFCHRLLKPRHDGLVSDITCSTRCARCTDLISWRLGGCLCLWAAWAELAAGQRVSLARRIHLSGRRSSFASSYSSYSPSSLSSRHQNARGSNGRSSSRLLSSSIGPGCNLSNCACRACCLSTLLLHAYCFTFFVPSFPSCSWLLFTLDSASLC